MKRYFFIALLGLSISCGRSPETIHPSTESITESVYASGTISTTDQYQVFPAAAGVIQKVWVQEGDSVKKGTLLAVLVNDVAGYNQQSAALKATFDSRETNQGKLTDAQRLADMAYQKMKVDSALYKRQQNLWAEQIGTRVELEQRELAWQNAQTEHQLALQRIKDLQKQITFTDQLSQKNLQIAAKMKGDYEVRSESEGVVFKWLKIAGEFANQQTPLGIIGNPQKYVLEMQVDESDITHIKLGLPVAITMDSYKGRVFEASVTRILPMMNEKNKTFLVEAQFTKRPEQIFPNTSFEANIILNTKDSVLLIPRNYLLNDSTVLDKAGKPVHVVTGIKDFSRVEIISGLKASDELIKPKE
jgi:multidrug efflux pump subunit AcrA (membrane-fusion protein)